MAAPQRHPDWAAFRAASGRIHQSANHLVQALQASANIPADSAEISSELEQLEHQPSNAMLLQQVQQLQLQMQQQFHQLQQQFQQLSQQQLQQLDALNHNTTARIVNASLQNASDQLAPLVNPQTNAPIAYFPGGSAALVGLSWPQRRALGISLAIADPGANPNSAVKATFFRQLCSTIGLKPRPA